MKYTTLVTSATTTVLALMTFMAVHIWKSMFSFETKPKLNLSIKTIKIPQTNLGGSKKSSRPPFDMLVIYKSPVQNSIQDLAKR